MTNQYVIQIIYTAQFQKRTILHSENNFSMPSNILFKLKNMEFPIPKSNSNKHYMFKSILMKDCYKNYDEYSKTLYTLINIYR